MCSAFDPATAQCFRNGHFILVLSQETALAHRVTLASIRLAYAPTGCSPTQDTGAFIVFHFPFSRCGTTVQVGTGASGGAPYWSLGGSRHAVFSHRWLATSSSMRTS